MKITLALLLIGVVDSVDDGVAASEVSPPEGDEVMMYFPLEIFPCDIKEGDVFYLTFVDGVTEVRCGFPVDAEDEL